MNIQRYLEIADLSYDSILAFIRAAEQPEFSLSVFLLGKAQAYIDTAYALECVTLEEAIDLFFFIETYLS